MARERLVELDILRAIACITVIVSHTSAVVMALPVEHSGNDTLFLAFTLLNRSVKFTVPLFVFISGVVLYYNYGSPDKPLQYGSFLKKRITLTGIPYLFWSVLYFFYFISCGYFDFDLETLIHDIFFGDVVYHLYFVVVIIQFYIIFGLIKWTMNRYNHKQVLFIAFLLNFAAYFVQAQFYHFIHFEYDDRIFYVYLFFFIMGCYYGGNYEAIKKYFTPKKIFIILGIGILCLKTLILTYQFINPTVHFLGFINYNLSWYIFSSFDIVFFTWLAASYKEVLPNIIIKAVRKIGSASYYIYLMHPLMIYIITEYLDSVGIYSRTIYWSILLISVLVTTLTVTITYSTLKNKWRKRNKGTK